MSRPEAPHQASARPNPPSRQPVSPTPQGPPRGSRQPDRWSHGKFPARAPDRRFPDAVPTNAPRRPVRARPWPMRATRRADRLPSPPHWQKTRSHAKMIHARYGQTGINSRTASADHSRNPEEFLFRSRKGGVRHKRPARDVNHVHHLGIVGAQHVAGFAHHRAGKRIVLLVRRFRLGTIRRARPGVGRIRLVLGSLLLLLFLGFFLQPLALFLGLL